MREKNLFHLFLGLNLALAGAFVVYLFVASHRYPEVASTNFSIPHPTTNATPTPPPSPSLNPTNPEPDTADVPTNALSIVSEPATNTVEPVFTSRKFGWRDIEDDDYQSYIDSLRAVGCPEDKIRYIILTDINELMSQKRLAEAKNHDPQWWRSEPQASVASLLRDKGLTLDDERRELIAQWLGEEIASKEKGEVNYWSHVQLTGPVLGALDTEDHKVVQEVCAESMDRYQSIFWSSVNAGQPINAVKLANLRQRTRSELNKTLNPKEVEEFLLRYSHNANRLRQELRGFNPTPEEFRKIFNVTDAMDHAMQQEYGSIESLSPQQRQRHERRRDQAIQEVMAPKRYPAYLLTKDPLYRQAQMMVRNWGAPNSAIMPIYDMAKKNESRKQEIMSSNTLSADQKRRAVNAVSMEQHRSVQTIIAKAKSQNLTRP